MLLTISIILLFFIIALTFISTDNGTIISLICGASIFSLLTLALHFAIKPNALDVYRGNTMLKITYEGGIPTDTVVIFKK